MQMPTQVSQPTEANVHSYATLCLLKLWPSLGDPEFKSNARGYAAFPWDETSTRAITQALQGFSDLVRGLLNFLYAHNS